MFSWLCNKNKKSIKIKHLLSNKEFPRFLLLFNIFHVIIYIFFLRQRFSCQEHAVRQYILARCKLILFASIKCARGRLSFFFLPYIIYFASKKSEFPMISGLMVKIKSLVKIFLDCLCFWFLLFPYFNITIYVFRNVYFAWKT